MTNKNSDKQFVKTKIVGQKTFCENNKLWDKFLFVSLKQKFGFFLWFDIFPYYAIMQKKQNEKRCSKTGFALNTKLW